MRRVTKNSLVRRGLKGALELYTYQLPKIARVNEAIETKYLAQEDKNVGGNGARTQCLVIS